MIASIAADNLPSIRLAERMGMEPVEELIYSQDGQTVSYIVYALPTPEV